MMMLALDDPSLIKGSYQYNPLSTRALCAIHYWLHTYTTNICWWSEGRTWSTDWSESLWFRKYCYSVQWFVCQVIQLHSGAWILTLSSIQRNMIMDPSPAQVHWLSGSSTITTSSVPAHCSSQCPSQLWITIGTSVETVVFPWRFHFGGPSSEISGDFYPLVHAL